jgi:capsular polysaccharide biosynthesis protein
VWAAISAHRLLVIGAVVVLTLAGIGAAYVRHPKYKSTSTLAVQHFNFGANGAASGFSTAAPALADTYARSIHATPVIQALAKEFHMAPGVMNASLSAVAVPQTPVFTITATATRPGLAVALANAAGQQLLAYEENVNSTNPTVAALHDNLVKAEQTLAGAQAAKNVLQGSINGAVAARHGTSLTSAEQQDLGKAQAAISTAQDNVNALRSAYQQSFLSTSATQYINPIRGGTAASSDRTSRVELYGFVGFAVGLAVGVGLALIRQTRSRRLPAF